MNRRMKKSTPIDRDDPYGFVRQALAHITFTVEVESIGPGNVPETKRVWLRSVKHPHWHDNFLVANDAVGRFLPGAKIILHAKLGDYE